VTEKKERTLRDIEYGYDLFNISKKFLETEKQREVYKTMRKVFGVDPMLGTDVSMYKRGGYKQSKRKEEFMKMAHQIAVTVHGRRFI